MHQIGARSLSSSIQCLFILNLKTTWNHRLIVCLRHYFILCILRTKENVCSRRQELDFHSYVLKRREVSPAYSYPFVRYEKILSQMNKFSYGAGKLYALSVGESKPSTVTVLHLLPACYSLCCVNALRYSHRVKTPFCAIALYRS